MVGEMGVVDFSGLKIGFNAQAQRRGDEAGFAREVFLSWKRMHRGQNVDGGW
jgi:hypothetical protein